MPTNDFIGFASAGSANVMSQADYAAAAEQTDGVQPGPASSALANKIWRQGANMASAIGQIVTGAGYNALDNGDIATLKANIANAFSLHKNYTLLMSETLSVPSATITNLNSYTFAQTGIYLVNYIVNYRKQDSNGVRAVYVSNSATGNFIDIMSVQSNPSISVGFPVINLSKIENITANNTIRYLNAYQTSGNAIDSIGLIAAIRLGDN